MQPLVLLPGLRCDAHLWHAVAAGLSDLAAPTIPNLTLDDTITDMAKRVLVSAPARFALAGLSMGGYVALEIMRQAPERVTHLALLDTSARPDTEERKTARRAEMALVVQGKASLVSRTSLPNLLAAHHVGGPVGDAVHDMAMRVGDAAYYRQQEAIMGRADSRPHLAGIKVPTLVGVGAEDRLTPPELAEEMAAAIPDAEMVVFPEAGHVSTLENPLAVIEAMRAWLAR
ncbi:alpha/beta fold hydrolase [Devosia rhizoryzae]|nr:alpha/beta fold hydrolase [Devosia rhizoryzae]